MNPIDAANQVLQRAAELGFSIPSNCRFRRYLDVLAPSLDGSTLKTSNNKQFAEIIQAIIDVYQMRFILDSLSAFGSEQWTNILKVAISGISVSDPTKRSHLSEQTAQFELYIASILQNAGLFHAFGEPDLIALDKDDRFGFACKHLSSMPQLEKRIVEAREQIDKSRMPGVICLDLSYAQNRSREVLGSSLTPEEVDRVTGAYWKSFRDQYESVLNRWIGKSDHVLGTIVLEHIVHLPGQGRCRVVTSTLDIPASSQKAARKAPFTRLLDCFITGSMTPATIPPAERADDRQRMMDIIANEKRHKWR